MPHTLLAVRRRLVLAAVTLTAVSLLAGCGAGGSTSATAPSTTRSAATPTGSPARGRFDPVQFEKIRECLTAAGITLPTPTGTFTRPASPPGGTPTGRPGGGAFGAVLRSPAAQEALKACGIALPTRRPGSGTQPAG